MVKYRLLILTALVFVFARAVAAQTPAFTYQGKMTDNFATASGTYDMQFALYDALAGGTIISSNTINGVTASNGIFSVLLNFGADSFPGADRFLQVSVKRPADPGYTALTPRQQITSAPYAIRALSAPLPAVIGQTGSMVFGTAQVTVSSSTFVTIPGLSQTFTVPANSLVYISTDGGMVTGGPYAVDSGSMVDVGFSIDGSSPDVGCGGGFRRYTPQSWSHNGSRADGFEAWSMSCLLDLSPGTHTISVQSRLAFGNAAYLSQSSGFGNRGQLTVLILKK